MTKTDKLWVLLGFLFFLLLNYPLLEIFNRATLIGGIPLLCLYFFGVWLAAIVALGFFARRLISS